MKNRIIFFYKGTEGRYNKNKVVWLCISGYCCRNPKEINEKNYNVLKKCGEEIAVYHDGQSIDDKVMENILEDREFSYQVGETLGDKMYNAIEDELKSSDKVILLGSDIYNLQENIIYSAFEKLDEYDVVINPSVDGGYFLIGMKKAIKEVLISQAMGIIQCWRIYLLYVMNKS